MPFGLKKPLKKEGEQRIVKYGNVVFSGRYLRQKNDFAERE